MIHTDGSLSYAKTPNGLDVNGTLNSFQNSRTMAEEVDTLFKKFYHNLDAEDYPNAEQELEKIRRIIGDNNPKYTEAKNVYELEQIPLEE